MKITYFILGAVVFITLTLVFVKLATSEPLTWIAIVIMECIIFIPWIISHWKEEKQQKNK